MLLGAMVVAMVQELKVVTRVAVSVVMMVVVLMAEGMAAVTRVGGLTVGGMEEDKVVALVVAEVATKVAEVMEGVKVVEVKVAEKKGEEKEG